MLKTFIRDRKGNIYLNDSIRYVRSVIITPAANQYPIAIPAAPGAGARSMSPPVIYEGPADSVSKVYRLIASNPSTAISDVTLRQSCELTDTIYRRRLMNRDILVDHVFGQTLVPFDVAVTQLAPFKMCESLFLEPQQTIEGVFYNNSTAGPASIRTQLEAKQTQTPAWNRDDVKEEIARDRARKPYLYPYWLTTDAPITLGPGQVKDVFMTVTRDIRFVAFAQMARAIRVGVSAGDIVEMFTVEMLDGQTQRPMQNQPIARSCFGGNANNPYWLPTGWMLEPNSLVQLRVRSLLTAGNLDVFLTWAGTACFVG
jgi:hypothetical protein